VNMGRTSTTLRNCGIPACTRQLPFVLSLFFFFLLFCKPMFSILKRPSGGVRGRLVKDLRTYSFLPGVDQPTFLQEVNPDQITKGDVVTIDYAHRHGLMHMAAVILLSDVSGDVLLLKRQPHLATCPNSWGVIGEHSIVDEEALKNAKRRILEELGQSALDAVASFHKLANYPIYMDREFGDKGAVDKQLLYMWEARVEKPKEEIVLELDEEVADHRWISLDKYLDWIDRDLNKPVGAPRDFCCDVVAKIRQFEAARLKAYRQSETKR